MDAVSVINVRDGRKKVSDALIFSAVLVICCKVPDVVQFSYQIVMKLLSIVRLYNMVRIGSG